MNEITAVTAAISSVKNALDIVKAIRDADKSLEKAETKLEITKLYELLVEAKDQAINAKGALQDNNKRIAELEEALAFKGRVSRRYDAYYELDAENNLFGEPYCSYCWEVNLKAVHLVKDNRHNPFCPACKTEYNRSRAATIETDQV